MPLTMSQLSKPVFERGLEALAEVLRKGQEFAAGKKLDDVVFTQARLYPDMFPLTGQVQRASDSAKGAVARLSGAAVPSFADTETSFAELQARVAKTLEYVRSVPDSAIDGSEKRRVEIKARQLLVFDGSDYLLGFALPNFYFHVTAAYAILRHNGVDVGKLDYLGKVPLISAT